MDPVTMVAGSLATNLLAGLKTEAGRAWDDLSVEQREAVVGLVKDAAKLTLRVQLGEVRADEARREFAHLKAQVLNVSVIGARVLERAFVGAVSEAGLAVVRMV